MAKDKELFSASLLNLAKNHFSHCHELGLSIKRVIAAIVRQFLGVIYEKD